MAAFGYSDCLDCRRRFWFRCGIYRRRPDEPGANYHQSGGSLLTPLNEMRYYIAK